MTEKKKDLRTKLEEARGTPKSKQRGSMGESHPSWGEPETAEKSIRKRNDRPLKIFGAICLAIGIGTVAFSGSTSPSSSEAAKNALETKVSSGVSAGTILLRSDENIGAKDYTIEHTHAGDQAKLWIWDYAAEDGDFVQVIVDGVPTSEPFMIKHKPKVITVPAIGTIEVKGIRDGGGGITYAVRYEANGTSYFNSAPEGEFNTYTLKRK
ncbi:hypothetical protein [Sporosarcina highlanderae]|uniref:DUF5590 domain-containing protein n=1 Tax=Sporosarcina highlanderae TaxID=3035916 RepID=A0ABT8JTP8_9BACL|nr:hypothetical protein [Sporosarcina highlanderae]MDN4608464.1 hypothetical protein [Sporosarcina highlanderae]